MLEVKFVGKDTLDICDQMWDFINCAIATPVEGQPIVEHTETSPTGEASAKQTRQPVDLDIRHPHGNTPRPDASVEQTQPEEASDPAEDTDSSDPVSYDECLVALKAYMKEHGKAKAVKVLTKYEVDRLSQLEEFGAIYKDLTCG